VDPDPQVRRSSKLAKQSLDEALLLCRFSWIHATIDRVVVKGAIALKPYNRYSNGAVINQVYKIDKDVPAPQCLSSRQYRVFMIESMLYLFAATYGFWQIHNANLATQVLPFLQLVLVGVATIESSEAESLAFRPALGLQLFTPSTLRCETVKIAPEAAAGIVYEVAELSEPVAY
jgi:hypothetical protein